MGFARLRSDLIIKQAEIDGKIVYNVRDPITNKYFRLQEHVYWVATQLDGNTGSDTISAGFEKKYGQPMPETDVDAFVEMLRKMSFLDDGRSEQEISRKSYQAEQKRSLFSRLLFIKIKAFNPTKLLNVLLRLYRPLHNGFLLSIYVILIIAGSILFIANSESFSFSLNSIFSFSSVVAIILSLFIVVTLHEFAHAVICRYYGGEVREIGFLLLYFQPCFYSNLSDAWMFDKKSHRLAVTAAGPFFQLVLFAIAVFVWRVTVVGSFINDIAYIIVLVTFITFLFNFNPLIKLDGYYLLSDWLDIPNLRAKSFAYVGNAIKRNLLGWPIDKVESTPRERKVFVWYSLFALIYSAALIGYVLYLVGSFLEARLGRFGIVLLVGVVLFSLSKNIADFARGTFQHLVYMKNILKQPVRLTKYLVSLGIIIVVFFVVQFPHRVSGDVNVQPVLEFTLKLNEFGLLESKLRKGGEDPQNRASYLQMASTDMAVLELIPKVKDGQYVSAGDTLATLTSNQVSNDISAGMSELDRLEGQLAVLRAPPKREEILEAEAQVDAAKTKLRQSERELDRITGLADKKLATREQLEAVQSAFQIAEAELANKEARVALLKSPPRPEEESVIISEIEKQKSRLRFLQEQLDAQIIIAPIEGLVSASKAEESLMSVVDVREVEILVPVSDYDIHLVESGQDVKLKVRTFPSRVFFGKVVHIPKEAVTRNDKAYFMVSVVADNADGLLYDGMTGHAKIEIGEKSLFGLAARKVTSFVRVEFWSWW